MLRWLVLLNVGPLAPVANPFPSMPQVALTAELRSLDGGPCYPDGFEHVPDVVLAGVLPPGTNRPAALRKLVALGYIEKAETATFAFVAGTLPDGRVLSCGIRPGFCCPIDMAVHLDGKLAATEPFLPPVLAWGIAPGKLADVRRLISETPAAAPLDLIGRLRAAIVQCGATAKPDEIIAAAGCKREAGLKKLRELERTGQYRGFTQLPHESGGRAARPSKGSRTGTS
ncbi:MAG: hypothetical protein AB1716_09560 [Planctomycetota bacterium]